MILYLLSCVRWITSRAWLRIVSRLFFFRDTSARTGGTREGQAAKPRETRPVCIILTSRSARVALRNKGRPLVVYIVRGYKHYLFAFLGIWLLYEDTSGSTFFFFFSFFLLQNWTRTHRIHDPLFPSSIMYTIKTSSDFSVAFESTGCSGSAGGHAP